MSGKAYTANVVLVIYLASGNHRTQSFDSGGQPPPVSLGLGWAAAGAVDVER